MISVEEAKKCILDNVEQLSAVFIPLREATLLLLEEDIFAPMDIPAFDQSAMDGYVFTFSDWKTSESLIIEGEIPAGLFTTNEVKPKHAIRIFTGAAIPVGADTVIMQEKTKVSNGLLTIEDDQLKKGNAIRYKGSEIKSGELALEKGRPLTPAAIGFLASLGITEVKVIPKPKISILVTGTELQSLGTNLQPGKIYESNSFALLAALHQLNIYNVSIRHVDDQLELIKSELEKSLDTSDLILITGGVSVGDYDFVIEASRACGVSQIFHKVKQKPGKPLYFGKKGKQLVFGLPGNPSSVLTCFYEFVIPALNYLNPGIPGIKTRQLSLTTDITKKKGLTYFLKAVFNGDQLNVLDAQESYKLSSFAKANCLIYLKEEQDKYEKGDIVDIHLI